MPFINPNKYDNSCSNHLKDNQTNDSNKFRGIVFSEANSVAGTVVVRPVKTPKPIFED